MTIAAQCSCGAQFKARDELAGKTVRCPSCAQTFTVSGDGVLADRIRVACACGRAFQANRNLAGKQVACPACGNPLNVPLAAPAGVATDLFSADAGDDPFGLNALPGGPGLGAPQMNTLGAPQAPPQSFTFEPAANQSPFPPASPYTPPKKTRTRKARGVALDSDTFTIIVAILCILHGLGRTASLYGIYYLVSLGMVFSLSGIVALLTAAASLGIAIAGVGLLTNQYWAPRIGALSAMGYFLLMALGLIIGLIGSIPATGRLGFGWSVYLIPRLLAESLAPALLLYRASRDD